MTTRTPAHPAQRGGRYLFVLGLVAMGSGVILLLPIVESALRPVGAVMLLFGLVLTGSYFVGRLKAEISADNLALEPAWRKPAHGAAGYGSLPVMDAPVPAQPPARATPALGANERASASAENAGRRTVPARATTPAGPQAVAIWTSAMFDHMSPQQFDALCEALLGQGGFETRSQSHGAAGGATIWLYSRHAQQGKNSPVAVALCRQWPGQSVGPRELQPLLELMAAHCLTRGTCATLSGCSESVRKFAKIKGINLLDRNAVLDLITRRTPAQQEALLARVREKS
jgi:hypothetical protein